jgi:hypothetical protein
MKGIIARRRRARREDYDDDDLRDAGDHRLGSTRRALRDSRPTARPSRTLVSAKLDDGGGRACGGRESPQRWRQAEPIQEVQNGDCHESQRWWSISRRLEWKTPRRQSGRSAGSPASSRVLARRAASQGSTGTLHRASKEIERRGPAFSRDHAPGALVFAGYPDKNGGSEILSDFRRRQLCRVSRAASFGDASGPALR